MLGKLLSWILLSAIQRGKYVFVIPDFKTKIKGDSKKRINFLNSAGMY